MSVDSIISGSVHPASQRIQLPLYLSLLLAQVLSLTAPNCCHPFSTFSRNSVSLSGVRLQILRSLDLSCYCLRFLVVNHLTTSLRSYHVIRANVTKCFLRYQQENEQHIRYLEWLATPLNAANSDGL